MVGWEGQSMLKKVSLPYRDMCICVCANTQQPVPNENTISLLHTQRMAPSGPKVKRYCRLAITSSNLGLDSRFVFYILSIKDGVYM